MSSMAAVASGVVSQPRPVSSKGGRCVSSSGAAGVMRLSPSSGTMRARAAQIPRAVAKLPRSRGSAVVVHATKNGSESEANDHPEDWELKYLYDGACTVCKSLVALLKSKRGHEKIWFEDIAAKDFNPDNNKGITFEEAMDTIHVITRKDDKIFTGMEALTLLYDITGMGWLFKLAKFPVLSKAAEIAYKMVSKNRQSLSAGADGLLALGRISMEESGEGSCREDDECRDKPTPVDEEAEKAAAEAEARRARIAAENAAKAETKSSVNPAAAAATPPANTAPTSGELSDRRNILGVYDCRVSGSDARALRAAPIDTETGVLIDEMFLTPLHGDSLKDLAQALNVVVKHFGWQGNIGIGLPGRIAKDIAWTSSPDAIEQAEVEEEEEIKVGGSTKAELVGNNRLSRLEIERYLRNATGRDIVTITGAEATGYGEMCYGAGICATDFTTDGAADKGLTVVCTLGRSIGVCLFDEGVLVHNTRELDAQVATWNKARWARSNLPSSAESPTEETWELWAARVEHYLQRIEAVVKPDKFIIAGRASAPEYYSEWAHRMTKVNVPVYCAQRGLTAAVQGAAIGGAELLKLRYDMARIRSALGHKRGLSPQKVTDQMLVDVFTEFDQDRSGTISLDEIEKTIANLGVKVPKRELREMLVEMDYDVTGEVTMEEFVRWWKDSVQSNPVEVIHTMQEYEQVLEDEDGTGRMTVVMVGVTYCKPCKAFSRKYEDFANRFSNARFIKVFGNENKDMTRLARDELKVKSTPSFYIMRDKEQVHFHSGANAGKFEKAMLDNARDGDAGYGSEPQFAADLEKAVKKEAEKKAKEEAEKNKAESEKAAA